MGREVTTVTQPQSVLDFHAFGVGSTHIVEHPPCRHPQGPQPLTTQQSFLCDEHAGKGEGLLIIALEPLIHHLWQDQVVGLRGWGLAAVVGQPLGLQT